jgi:hypothetical protein
MATSRRPTALANTRELPNADKYRTIVQYMAEYTSHLMKISRGGESVLTDQMKGVLAHLERKMVELEGDGESHGYVTETLQELKNSILGNCWQVVKSRYHYLGDIICFRR